MWGSLKGRKRCVVLCQGYYEWQTKGKDKLPFFTKQTDGSLMYLAGLYDYVTLDGQKEPLWTFTIVTTDANKEFSWLHDRQPVILSSEYAINTWLDTTSQQWTAELAKLLLPYHDELSPLECYQVPKEVGKVGTESESYIHPVSQRKDGIQAMFAKQANKTSSKLSSTPDSPKPTVKRKRSPSPPVERTSTAESSDKKPKTSPGELRQSGKASTSNKVKEENGDSDDVIDLTETPSSPVKSTRKQESPSKRKFKNLDTDAKPNTKLTNFFKKAS